MIPFNKPYTTGKEHEYIQEAISGNQFIGDGPYARLCEDWLKENIGSARVLLTNSCTSALEIATILCGLKPGDEVILSSFTFVSTANAIVLRGATPVFVEIRPDT